MAEPAGSGSGAASTSSGWGRVLVAVYAVFALAATARSTYQLLAKASEAPLAYTLSAVAGVVYVLATLGLAEVGPSPRRLAWAAVVFELVGVLSVGTLTVLDPELFPDQTVWSSYGAGYGYLPLVLPFAGLAWLLRTRPAAASTDGSTGGSTGGSTDRPAR